MDSDCLGLVSNCWKVQLDAGEPLPKLIARAAETGFRFIELRQGCLGEFEDQQTRLPDVEALATFPEQFPEVTFDLAVELPIFSQSIDPTSSDVDILLKTAAAISKSGGSSDSRPAHLRIVDLISREVPAARSKVERSETGPHFQDVLTSLQNLARILAPGILSVEHSFQSWSGFRRLFEAAGIQNDHSTSRAPWLQLCFDPCNLWLTNDGDRANQITQSLPADWISMVHLKQRCNGVVSTRLEPGEVDWPAQLTALSRAGYKGPFLFETAPAEDVWQQLADSCRYFADLTK